LATTSGPGFHASGDRSFPEHLGCKLRTRFQVAYQHLRRLGAGGHCLADVKAKRIKLILQDIEEQRGNLDLSFLRELPLSEAKSWLRQLPGVGPKTAGCVLLFSLGMPALPVDTHVFRVARRLGLIDSKATPEKAHDVLEALIPAEEIYAFHLYLIEHGRRICKARRPRCHLCVLQQVCPSAAYEWHAQHMPAAMLHTVA